MYEKKRKEIINDETDVWDLLGIVFAVLFILLQFFLSYNLLGL